MVGAMYFNIRSFLHLVGASGQKESCAINLDNEYVFLLKIEKQLKIKNQKETLLLYPLKMNLLIYVIKSCFPGYAGYGFTFKIYINKIIV